jgi:hypothetical protein
VRVIVRRGAEIVVAENQQMNASELGIVVCLGQISIPIWCAEDGLAPKIAAGGIQG